MQAAAYVRMQVYVHCQFTCYIQLGHFQGRLDMIETCVQILTNNPYQQVQMNENQQALPSAAATVYVLYNEKARHASSMAIRALFDNDMSAAPDWQVVVLGGVKCS